MDWLNGFNPGAIAGFGATGVVVISGIMYALAFQKRFTDRMAQQGEKDVARIEKLEKLLDLSRRETRLARECGEGLRLMVIRAGLDPGPMLEEIGD